MAGDEDLMPDELGEAEGGEAEGEGIEVRIGMCGRTRRVQAADGTLPDQSALIR